jgi:alpha-mannosidase
MLKLKYPVKINFRRPCYGIPYGFLEKSANGEEEPGQGWIDITGEQESETGPRIYGLALVNDCKYSYSMDVDEMAVTLLKNAVFAHHDPHELLPGREYRFIERGIQELTYALFPHSGSWRDHGIPKREAELKQPPLCLTESFHPEQFPQRRELLSLDREEIMITVLKDAEEGDGCILRAAETTGNRVETVLSMPLFSRECCLSFSPGEIKTIKIPRDPAQPVREVNMLEIEETAD